jgi:hypothetical protein
MTIIISLIASIYVLYLMHNPTNINYTDSDIMCLTGSPLVFEILHGHYDDLDNLTNNFVDGDLPYEPDIIVEFLDESLDEPEILVESFDESLDEPEIVVEFLDEPIIEQFTILSVDDLLVDDLLVDDLLVDDLLVDDLLVDDLLVDDLLVDDLLVDDLLVDDLLVDDLYGNFEDEYIELPLLYQANETRINQHWATRTPISLLHNIPSRMTH